MNRTIVINATNLGRYIDGIGVYVLNLLREIADIDGDRRFIIYVNRSSAGHIRDIRFSDRCELRWVSGAVSPDHGFAGHLLRLLYSNYLGLRHYRSVVFVASQLEAILIRRNQIIMIHDIIPLLFGNLHKKQYLYFKYILGHVLHRARWVITPSLHTKELLIARYGLESSKVEVIHNGVRVSLSPAAQDQGEEEGPGFILFSGRFVPMKNFTGLVRAFSLLKDKVPHRVVVTGRCRNQKVKESAMELLTRHSIDHERVVFMGHVSGPEMDDLLNRASLVVFPSFYEGFGLPPLEGMAHGCPVVVSKVSSLPEVCGDAAHYVDPADDKSIADGIYAMLTDQELRKEMVTRGLRRAKQFRWRDSALRHLALFDAALIAHRTMVDLRALEWRFGAFMQAHPSFGFVLSLLFRYHHHIR